MGEALMFKWTEAEKGRWKHPARPPNEESEQQTDPRVCPDWLSVLRCKNRRKRVLESLLR